MRAMVIDDSRATRSILGRLLGSLGFAVVAAENGAEGLSLLGTDGPFDLVLVDWNMPVMDGLSFVQAVRDDRALDAVKLVMVTTEGDTDHLVTALEAGADEYVMKPFTADVIREKLAIVGIDA